MKYNQELEMTLEWIYTQLSLGRLTSSDATYQVNKLVKKHGTRDADLHCLEQISNVRALFFSPNMTQAELSPL